MSLAATVDDEGGPRAPDLELRQEARKPGIFDDDRQDALALLIDVDRPRERDRRPLAGGMVRHPEPLRLVRAEPGLEPGLIGNAERGRLEAAVGELDVAGHHVIFIDAALAGMIRQRDLHHLQAAVAELVRGEEGAIGPTEGDPGNRRLRLQLRQEHELALVGLAGVEHVLQK